MTKRKTGVASKQGKAQLSVSRSERMAGVRRYNEAMQVLRTIFPESIKRISKEETGRKGFLLPRSMNCSFCGRGVGKARGDAKQLITGPSVYIRNDCVELCHDILIMDDLEFAKPAEVKKRIRLLYTSGKLHQTTLSSWLSEMASQWNKVSLSGRKAAAAVIRYLDESKAVRSG